MQFVKEMMTGSSARTLTGPDPVRAHVQEGRRTPPLLAHWLDVRRTKSPRGETASITPTLGSRPDVAVPLQLLGKLDGQGVVAATSPLANRRSRILFVTEKKRRMRFMVDFGADVSAIPTTPAYRLTPHLSLPLHSINHSSIGTLGQKFISLDLGFATRSLSSLY